MKFNAFELLVSRFLTRFPGVKKKAKWLYQAANYAVYKKNYKITPGVRIRSFDFNDLETFFGYYDKCPLSPDGSHILFHASRHNTNRLPDPASPVQIILGNTQTGSSKVIAETSAYNWQQGARLQWLNNTEFIFNDFDKIAKSYCSRILNKDGAEIRKISFPVYDHNNGAAFTLNFDRLSRMRPDYGYRNKDVSSIDLDDYSNDGIFSCDLNRGRKELIVSYDQLFQLNPSEAWKGAKHKVNHIMVSPSGGKIMFLHRWFTGKGKTDRLCVYDVQNKKVSVVFEGMVSHCCWDGEERVIGFIGSDTKPSGYYSIELDSTSVKTIGVLKGFSDGHPGIKGNRIVIDSYPDKSRMKQLYVTNENLSKVEIVAEFFESLTYYGESRCDLHPRWDRTGESVFVDSVHEGKRKLYQLTLER